MDYNKILKYIYPVIVIVIGLLLSYVSIESRMGWGYKSVMYITTITLLIIVGRIIYKK